MSAMGDKRPYLFSNFQFQLTIIQLHLSAIAFFRLLPKTRVTMIGSVIFNDILINTYKLQSVMVYL